MAIQSVPPLVLTDPTDDPERYELLSGRWVKKDVGRKEHSKMGRVLFELLQPSAEKLGCELELEWSVIKNGERIIPDVTMSFPAPNFRIENDYLIAPAFLVIETRSKNRRLRSLFDKCRNEHHRIGNSTCWIIDIDEELGYQYDLGSAPASVDLLKCTDAIELPVPSIFEAFRGKR